MTAFVNTSAKSQHSNAQINIDKILMQSELPRPNPPKALESDQGCTSMIYLKNAGDKKAADVI